MRSSAPVVHLPTSPPERRMRSLMPHNERERRRKQKEQLPLADDDFELRFHDGPEQLYAKRPRVDGSERVDDMSSAPDFESMLYADFHAKYEIRRYTKLTKGGNSRPGQLALGQGVGYWLLDYGEH